MNEEQQQQQQQSRQEPEGGRGAGKSKESLLSRDAKLLITWVLVNSIPIGYMNVVPLVYLVDVGYDPSLIGAIYAAGAVANTIAYIPFGILADRYGRKIFVIIGGLVPAISYAIFGLTLDPTWLIIASVVGGVGFAGGLGVAIQSPAILPLLAASTSEKNRTMLFGVTNGAFILALTIGGLLSFLPSFLGSQFSLDSHIAHSYSYFLMALIVIVSTIPVLFVRERRNREEEVVSSSLSSSSSSSSSSSCSSIRPEATTITEGSAGGKGNQEEEEEKEKRKKKRKFSRKQLLPVASGRKIVNFSIIFAFAGLGLGVIVQLMPTWYALRFGTSETTAGLAIAVAEFAGIFSIPVIPRLVKQRGTVITSVATTILSAVFLGLTPLAGFFALAAAMLVFRNVFMTIAWPVQQSYMIGVVEESERATVVGITYTAWGVAASIATFLGGYLLGVGLLSVPFVISFASYVVSSLLLYYMFRHIRPPEEIELDVTSSEVKTT
jgi:MFS family permease